MMRNKIIDSLETLRSAVIDANAIAYVASTNLLVAKKLLQDQEDSLLMANLIDGKNAEIRAAQMRDLSANERETVLLAEREFEGAKVTLANRQTELRIDIALVELIKGVA